MEGVLLGGYRLLRLIGQGGMGAVWMAEHVALGRRAAVKLLHHAYSNRSDVLTRFFNEARTAAAISDPGIVQIFDFGHHSDGSAYIVMELLEGEPLDRRLARGPLPLREALRLLRQVASSLGAVHARGIVHRDLKPENIFMVRDIEVPGGERPKLLDFGIAKLFGDAQSQTNTTALMGTPRYMSPEQCRGAGFVDERSDVYSLGCVLFQLVAGRPPFDAEGHGEIIAMHLREKPPRLSKFAKVPSAVEALVARCLDKDPSRRFASGNTLAEALALLAPLADDATSPSAIRHRAKPVGPSPVTTLSTSAVTLPVVRSGSGRRRWGVIVMTTIGSLSAAGFGFAIITMIRSREPSEVHEPQRSSEVAFSNVSRENEVIHASLVRVDAGGVDAGEMDAGGMDAAAIAAVMAPERVAPVDAGNEPMVSPNTQRVAKRAQGSDAKPVASRVMAKKPEPLPPPPPPTTVQQASDDERPPEIALRASNAGASYPRPKLGLTREQVVQGLESVRGALARCGTDYSGVTVKAAVTVAPDGRVTTVAVEDSPSARLTVCVSVSLKSAHFAPTRIGGSFRKPFHF